MSETTKKVTVVGAGLAGTECAWQLAIRGVDVELIEQKPKQRTPAQNHDFFAELVCSNSLRGAALANAVGLLKEELRRSGSLILSCADFAKVPAGGALAVDREVFGNEVTRRLQEHPNVTVVAERAMAIPDRDHPVVLATGPLTGDELAADLGNAVGEEYLAYYDAIAPVIQTESINWDIVFKASRYDKGGDDAYGNIPLNEEEYHAFLEAVLGAEKVTPHGFEEVRYFEGCLPLEVMAERGPLTLAFGPMKPVGLTDPRTGEQPFAVVQLRQENADASAYNMVGFQTRMKWPEQKRVFRMLPGLEKAEFERLGSIHRNTFVKGPEVLTPDMELKARPGVYLAGQITGVEGYVESAASGFVLGARLATKLMTGEDAPLPETTVGLGALFAHPLHETKDYQPSNIVWSHFPKLPGKKIRKRRLRREALAARALEGLPTWLETLAPRIHDAE